MLGEGHFRVRNLTNAVQEGQKTSLKCSVFFGYYSFFSLLFCLVFMQKYDTQQGENEIPTPSLSLSLIPLLLNI